MVLWSYSLCFNGWIFAFRRAEPHGSVQESKFLSASCFVFLVMLECVHNSVFFQICKADFSFPPWFSSNAKKLIKRILDPNPLTVSSKTISITFLFVQHFPVARPLNYSLFLDSICYGRFCIGGWDYIWIIILWLLKWSDRMWNMDCGLRLWLDDYV